MHLHLRAESPHLSKSHARALDEEFFLAHPAAYFASCITSLLDAQRTTVAPAQTDAPEFFAALGLTKIDSLLAFDEQDRQLQIAVEAFSLRHQAAEALLRFMYAVAKKSRCVEHTASRCG